MNPDTALVWGIGLVLVVVTTVPFVIRQRRKERRYSGCGGQGQA